jgi:hypothetical protein
MDNPRDRGELDRERMDEDAKAIGDEEFEDIEEGDEEDLEDEEETTPSE